MMSNEPKNQKTIEPNTDRAQLESLGTYFSDVDSGKIAKKQLPAQPLSAETQKGLRELAAREANF
jgi:hypothetical protein